MTLLFEGTCAPIPPLSKDRDAVPPSFIPVPASLVPVLHNFTPTVLEGRAAHVLTAYDFSPWMSEAETVFVYKTLSTLSINDAACGPTWVDQ